MLADGVGGAADVVQGPHFFVTRGWLGHHAANIATVLLSMAALNLWKKASKMFPNHSGPLWRCSNVARAIVSPSSSRPLDGWACMERAAAVAAAVVVAHYTSSIESLICHEIRSSLARFVDGASEWREVRGSS